MEHHPNRAVSGITAVTDGSEELAVQSIEEVFDPRKSFQRRSFTNLSKFVGLRESGKFKRSYIWLNDNVRRFYSNGVDAGILNQQATQ